MLVESDIDPDARTSPMPDKPNFLEAFSTHIGIGVVGNMTVTRPNVTDQNCAFSHASMIEKRMGAVVQKTPTHNSHEVYDNATEMKVGTDLQQVCNQIGDEVVDK